MIDRKQKKEGINKRKREIKFKEEIKCVQRS